MREYYEDYWAVLDLWYAEEFSCSASLYFTTSEDFIIEDSYFISHYKYDVNLIFNI